MSKDTIIQTKSLSLLDRNKTPIDESLESNQRIKKIWIQSNKLKELTKIQQISNCDKGRRRK